jgi:hypothetical protein
MNVPTLSIRLFHGMANIQAQGKRGFIIIIISSSSSSSFSDETWESIYLSGDIDITLKRSYSLFYIWNHVFQFGVSVQKIKLTSLSPKTKIFHVTVNSLVI